MRTLAAPIHCAPPKKIARSESVQLSPNRDTINVETLNAATIDDLRRKLLQRRFDIVHFSGHGTQTGLAFETADGRLMIPPSEALAELLKRHQVEAVLLNACFSLSVGRLVGMGVSFTVASTGAIADPAAIEFTRGFYDAVGAGRDADEAYREGMSSVKLKGLTLPAILLHADEAYVAPIMPLQDSSAAPLQAEQSVVRRSSGQGSNILAGVAIDLSGSMRESIRNDANSAMSRLEGVQQALRGMTSSLYGRLEESSIEIGFRAFVYGFGLRIHSGVADLTSVMRAAQEIDLPAEIARRRAHYERQARQTTTQYSGLAGLARDFGFGRAVDDFTEAAKAKVAEKIAGEILSLLLERAKLIGDSTLSGREFADLWDPASKTPSLNEVEQLIYGVTPMRAVATEINARFDRTPSVGDNELRYLLVLSDGEPSDGDPSEIFGGMKQKGTQIISCFVTASDIANPRVLWARPRDNWSAGAKLMFDIATPIDERGPLGRNLLARGWEIEAGARMFVQVNHSAILEEFIGAVETMGSVSQLLPEGR